MKLRADRLAYLVTGVTSLVLHALLLEGLGSAARQAPARPRTLELAVLAPKPPPPPVVPPPPVAVEAEKPTKRPPPPVKPPEPTPPPPEVPPPPNTTEPPPPDAEPAKPVFGISMSSTVGPGSGSGLRVRVGNTLMQDPDEKATPPAEVKPYAPPVEKYVPVYKVSQAPRRQGECKGDYPPAAKAQGIEGQVKLDVTIEADGAVGEVRVITGLGHGLDEAAVKALRRCRFEPALVEGKPVATRIQYTYTFIIES